MPPGCSKGGAFIHDPKVRLNKNGPPYDKTNKMACAPSKDSDQPGHLPSLIRVFAVCMKNAWRMLKSFVTNWAHSEDWSDWADGCPGWSESSLGAHVILLVLLWGGSTVCVFPVSESYLHFCLSPEYIRDKKKETHTVKHQFLWKMESYNNFVYIILKACHWLIDCPSFVSLSQKCVQENWLQQDEGQFVNLQKTCVFVCSLLG